MDSPKFYVIPQHTANPLPLFSTIKVTNTSEPKEMPPKSCQYQDGTRPLGGWGGFFVFFFFFFFPPFSPSPHFFHPVCVFFCYLVFTFVLGFFFFLPLFPPPPVSPTRTLGQNWNKVSRVLAPFTPLFGPFFCPTPCKLE